MELGYKVGTFLEDTLNQLQNLYHRLQQTRIVQCFHCNLQRCTCFCNVCNRQCQLHALQTYIHLVICSESIPILFQRPSVSPCAHTHTHHVHTHTPCACTLVVKTFKNLTAQRVPSECSQLRYTSDILEYLFKSTAERVPSECS